MSKQAWHVGARFEIAGAEKAVDNGVFEITMCLPPQPNGDDYWLYRRIVKGKVSTSNGTANLRGGRASKLDTIAKML